MSIGFSSSFPTNPSKRPDIIFAYANVFGSLEHDVFKPLQDYEILSPDEMFSEIEKAVNQTKRKGLTL